GAPLRMDQEGVDAGPPRRAERLRQDLARLFEIDVAHHVERAVEITVADGGDEDIADLAMIDAGDLLGRLRIHREDLGALRRTVRLGQARAELRNSSMQSNSRSGVCTAM